ncbi:MAG: LysR family transcriptional regulator [Oscillospiraceae bacterium]|nr:LysR family transcriptional regulator [Oscillospiraceae bacterium]
MLDFRIATFLTLCETRSYTQTATMLNITQPSVTQHIKHLQKKYHCILFHYESKTLRLTQAGEYLRAHAEEMTRISAKIVSDLQRMGLDEKLLRLGCPGELGETAITKIAANMMQSGFGKIALVIRDTPELLAMLNNSDLDLVLTDAYYQDSRFQTESVGEVPFAVYAGTELAEKYAQCRLEELFINPLLLQNPGSSARRILEDCLTRRNAFPESFADKITAGSDNCLRELASSGMGILFAYRSSMQDAVDQKKLAEIAISDFSEKRSLVFQYKKNNQEQNRFPEFFRTFQMLWNAMLQN